MLLFTLCIASDHSEQSALPSSTKYRQSILMLQFFKLISDDMRMRFCHGDLNSDVCTWWGVGCTDGIIETIVYQKEISAGNFQLQAVPPTVASLSIIGCDQLYKVETRFLPRKACIIQLSNNAIYGSIDLTALPEELWKLSLRQNVITGAIVLTSLPASLTSLDLSGNRIEQKFLPYKSLPAGISEINLNGPAMRIQEICALVPEDLMNGKKVILSTNSRFSY